MHSFSCAVPIYAATAIAVFAPACGHAASKIEVAESAFSTPAYPEANGERSTYPYHIVHCPNPKAYCYVEIPTPKETLIPMGSQVRVMTQNNASDATQVVQATIACEYHQDIGSMNKTPGQSCYTSGADIKPLKFVLGDKLKSELLYSKSYGFWITDYKLENGQILEPGRIRIYTSPGVSARIQFAR